MADLPSRNCLITAVATPLTAELAPDAALLIAHCRSLLAARCDAPALVRRLVVRHPGIIAGIKDSGGDWDKTAALLRELPDLQVLTGTEIHLPRAIAAGAAGTICGLGNIMPGLLRRLIDRPDLAAR